MVGGKQSYLFPFPQREIAAACSCPAATCSQGTPLHVCSGTWQIVLGGVEEAVALPGFLGALWGCCGGDLGVWSLTGSRSTDLGRQALVLGSVHYSHVHHLFLNAFFEILGIPFHVYVFCASKAFEVVQSTCAHSSGHAVSVKYLLAVKDAFKKKTNKPPTPCILYRFKAGIFKSLLIIRHFHIALLLLS